MQRNFFRPYQVGDLPMIWPDLRPDDLREYVTVGAGDPRLVEQYLLGHTKRVTTWDTEAGPVAVLGVTPAPDPFVGLVWAVASTHATDRWRFAVRNTQACLDRLGKGFLVLANFKDSRNTQQINWLRKVGFTFINTHENFEGTGVAFHEFVRIVR